MVIYKSNQGSMCLYYDGKLRASLPLNDRSWKPQYFYDHANKMIVDALRDKQSLEFIKNTLLITLKTNKKKLKIVTQDNPKLENQFIAFTILALIKLNVIDPDGDQEGILLCPPPDRKK